MKSVLCWFCVLLMLSGAKAFAQEKPSAREIGKHSDLPAMLQTQHAATPNLEQLSPEKFFNALRASSGVTKLRGSLRHFSPNAADSLPDLSVYAIFLAQNESGENPVVNPFVGQNIFLTIYFANLGNAPATGFQINTEIDAAPICTYYNPSFTVEKNTYWRYTCYAWSATPGTHTYSGRIDVFNTVTESNESNNDTSIVRTTTSLPTSGLSLWLEADSGVVRNGSNKVSDWMDLSGNGNNVSQNSGSLKPGFVDSSINGKPAVRFSNNSLETGILPANGNSAFTIFSVLKYTTVPANIAVPVWSGSNLPGDLGYAFGAIDSSGRISSYWTSGGATSDDSVEAGAFRLYESAYDQSTHSVYVNGVKLSQVPFSGSNVTAGTFTLGRIGGSPASSFDGEIAEVIVYDRILSAAEKSLLEQYLGAKYAFPDVGIPFTLSRTSLNFGDVVIGTSKTDSVVLTNKSSSSLNLFTFASTGVFSVSPSLLSVEPHQRITLSVSFTPQVYEAAETGQIYFSGYPLSFPLSGTGRGPSNFTLLPHSLDFGIVNLGGTKIDSVLLTNNTPDSMAVSTESIHYAFSVAPQQFVLPPYGGRYVQLSFKPVYTFTDGTSLWITINGIKYLYPVSGTGSGPQIYTSYRTLNAGDVYFRSQKTISTSFENEGNRMLLIDSIRSDNDRYFVDGSPDSVAPGIWKALVVRYVPRDAQNHSGHIILYSNASTSPDSFQVYGNGYPSWLKLASPTADFGPTFVDSQQIHRRSVASTVPYSVKFTVANSNETDFTWGSPQDSISPWGYLYRMLTFHPAGTGLRTGAMVFVPNDTLPSETLRVTGTGVAWFSTPPTSTTWQWLNPFPQGNNLFGTVMTDSNTVIAVGDAGTILKSGDGGNHWKVKHFVNGIAGFADVTNAGQNILVAVGGNKILRSTDHGDTWGTVFEAASGPYQFTNLTKVSFANELVGTVLDGSGPIYRTHDGGITWSKKELNFQNYDVVSLGSDTVIVVGGELFFGAEGHILRSTDDGNSWPDTLFPTLPLSPPGVSVPMTAIAFLDDMHGLAAGRDVYSGGTIFRTDDGGRTWTFVKSQIGGGAPIDIHIFDQLNYLIDFPGSGILRTADGGNAWSVADSGQSLFAMSFSDRWHGAAVGLSGKIDRTSDGGATWYPTIKGSTIGLVAASFVDPHVGFVLGGSYTSASLLRTTDGGNNWEEKPVPGNNASAISFADGRNGIILGYLWVRRTTDGGNTWIQQSTPAVQEYYSVALRDSLHGVITGHLNGKAVILYTSDGGSTWTNRVNNVTSFLFDVTYADSSTVIAVGSGGIVFRSVDAGVSWTTSFLPVTILYSVSFGDPLNGIAVGEGKASVPVTLQTTDGGVTWNTHYVDNFSSLRKVTVIDKKRAYASGYQAAIDFPAGVLKTENGGITWTAEQIPTSNYLTDLRCIRYPNRGGMVFGVGANGTIICNAISPLNPKTWTGAVDTSWNNDFNWDPSGIPQPSDSVIIPAAPHAPIVFQQQNHIVIAALTVQSGGHLTLTDSLQEFVVMGDVFVNGTLEIRPPGQITIIAGRNWIVNPGGLRIHAPSATGGGFVPANSTVFFGGSGILAGDFYNIVFDSGSAMKSYSNISVGGACLMAGDAELQRTDTLVIQSPDAHALSGTGRLHRGTIRRNIQQNSTDLYRFGTSTTFIRFLGSVNPPSQANADATPLRSIPSFVNVTEYPDSSVKEVWTRVPARIDTLHHTIIADTITHFSKWAIGVIRPGANLPKTGSRQLDTTAVLLRFYDITADTNAGFLAQLSLHYEPSELPPGAVQDSLKLFWADSSGNIITGIDGGKQPQLPATFALEQNYPNPFNPVTVIRYQLPVQSYVTLKVYNILGQVVRTLVDGTRDAGYQSATFDAGNLASGVYFYKIDAEGVGDSRKSFTDAKKMLILR